MMHMCHGTVLHIFECCGGGGAAVGSDHELIAASCSSDPSKRNKAYYPQGHFLRALMSIMTELTAEFGYFSVSELHARMANAGPSLDPKLYIQPWYSLGSCAGHSAILARPKALMAPAIPSKSRKALQEKEDYVLLHITVDADEAEVKEFQRWLNSSSRPDYVNRVKMLGYCASKGYLLFVTMPMSLWDVLPEHPAYVFVNFIPNQDLDSYAPATTQAQGPADYAEHMIEKTEPGADI
ncbi:MAG: hypothetical protein L6R40_003809 [Gallowayella cf. fulva]|nr:MAG: hypothetical protein L6R40_003809 [Xanthomendoza cf. fulva]